MTYHWGLRGFKLIKYKVNAFLYSVRHIMFNVVKELSVKMLEAQKNTGKRAYSYACGKLQQSTAFAPSNGY